MKLFGRTGHKLMVMTCSVILALTLVACGSANTGSSSTPTSSKAPGQGCTKIGVSLPETNTSYRWDNQDKPALLKDIPAAIPGSQVLYNNAGGDATVQQSQVETMITQGACILVVAPHDSKTAAAIVASAKQKNIPVISYDRLINSADLTAYVSFDNVAVGDLQGSYIAQHYQSFVTANGTNNAVLINGAQTDNNALLFKQGLHKALDPLFSANTLKNAYESFTDWTAPTASKDFEAALTQTGNKLAIAYVANDDMATAVITALKAHNLAGKVLVTGQDASITGIQNVMTGLQAMTVYKAIAKEAQSTADVVKALYNGQAASTVATTTTLEPISGKNIATVALTPVAVDKTNVAATVLADNFWTKAQICANVPAGTDGIC
ncbi:MAG TPA: substrate-binding domain-containing protein [Ktedonobacteraceae bacterium]